MESGREDDLVVLLDVAGRRIGTALKSEVHHTATPLHLAFSSYLFDDAGRVLMTRRALHKRTFPGIWTNSCCGHPIPGEAPIDAVSRRVGEELGIDVADLRCVLPDFRYRAVAADGVMENEVCPVYFGRAVGAVCPNPDEVMDHVWASWEQLRAVARIPWATSPWAAQQIPLLEEAGVAPRG